MHNILGKIANLKGHTLEMFMHAWVPAVGPRGENPDKQLLAWRGLVKQPVFVEKRVDGHMVEAAVSRPRNRSKKRRGKSGPRSKRSRLVTSIAVPEAPRASPVGTLSARTIRSRKRLFQWAGPKIIKLDKQPGLSSAQRQRRIHRVLCRLYLCKPILEAVWPIVLRIRRERAERRKKSRALRARDAARRAAANFVHTTASQEMSGLVASPGGTTLTLPAAFGSLSKKAEPATPKRTFVCGACGKVKEGFPERPNYSQRMILVSEFACRACIASVGARIAERVGSSKKGSRR